MFAKNSPRLIIIGVILLWAIYALFPTIRYETLSTEEKEVRRTEGTLEDLEKKIIHQGLDLKGGMHIVLEVDVPTLVDNLAINKNERFYDVLNTTTEKTVIVEQDFIDLFFQEANAQDVNLRRYFPDFGADVPSIKSSLEEEATDAIKRALEILQNRVDQFGVSEPTIQKQGNRRIIIELAGIDDPQRARDLLQSTALLEFVLLKNPEITQDIVTRIDKILRGKDEPEEVLAAEEDTVEKEQKTVQEEEVSLTDLFGEVEVEEDTSMKDTSGILIDQELFEERPFSSLLRNLGGDLGVPERNVYAVRKILEMDDVSKLMFNDDGIIRWSHEKETWTTPEGEKESFYRLYYLEADPAVMGGVIKEARADIGATGSSSAGQPIVHLTMNSEGAKTWSRVTGANVDRRVAIVLDKKVHMAPVIRTKISDGRTQVEGFANINEAKDIAIVLRAGALPAPVNIIEERTVGPSLGSDSIKMGTRAILIGLVLVLIFMLVYYRWSGSIADFALIWNIILVLSILAMLKATLTLPGIAGLILTIGMSVDANVIIFERIREELRKGKTVRAGIDSGYKRALTTIIDANVTTILAALVLMQFGTGPIKGFAIVLFWGVTISMFTAIFITRTIFNMITSRKALQTLSI